MSKDELVIKFVHHLNQILALINEGYEIKNITIKVTCVKNDKHRISSIDIE